MRLSADGDVAVEMLERAQDCVICMQPFDVTGADASAITPCAHVRYLGFSALFLLLMHALGFPRILFAAGGPRLRQIETLNPYSSFTFNAELKDAPNP